MAKEIVKRRSFAFFHQVPPDEVVVVRNVLSGHLTPRLRDDTGPIRGDLLSPDKDLFLKRGKVIGQVQGEIQPDRRIFLALPLVTEIFHVKTSLMSLDTPEEVNIRVKMKHPLDDSREIAVLTRPGMGINARIRPAFAADVIEALGRNLDVEDIVNDVARSTAPSVMGSEISWEEANTPENISDISRRAQKESKRILRESYPRFPSESLDMRVTFHGVPLPAQVQNAINQASAHEFDKMSMGPAGAQTVAELRELGDKAVVIRQGQSGGAVTMEDLLGVAQQLGGGVLEGVKKLLEENK